MTYIIRKGRDTAWLHDNHYRTILAWDAQIAPLPTDADVKQEAEPERATSSATTTNIEQQLNNHNARPRRETKAVDRYQAGYN